MSRAALCVLVVAVLLSAFGWWGLNSASGRRRFDEMAGMIPAAAYYVGLTLGIVSLLWLAWSAWRGRG